jgi:hypothetical protein
MRNLRHIAALTIIVLWLVASGIAFWWFQAKHISTFDAHFFEFNGELLQQSKIPDIGGQPTVVHFVDLSCPCSARAQAHIQELEETFTDMTTFYRWPDVPDTLGDVIKSANVPATPSVAIWADDGTLAYFGPYSSGFYCGDGKDFVFSTLESLQNGSNPEWINHDALGCYCAFNEASANSDQNRPSI